MTQAHFITLESGDELVILPRAEYERLRAAEAERTEDERDAAHANAILAGIRDGSQETLTRAEVDQLLTAPTPLAFWRRKRGLTQAGLARMLSVAQGYVSDLEAGRRDGPVAIYRRLAEALNLTLDDIAPTTGAADVVAGKRA